jgi:hypothetical protein
MASAPTGARAAWEALNDRQRTYLRVIFGHDQAAERSRGPYLPSRPAEEWRWLLYGVKSPWLLGLARPCNESSRGRTCWTRAPDRRWQSCAAEVSDW